VPLCQSGKRCLQAAPGTLKLISIACHLPAKSDIFCCLILSVRLLTQANQSEGLSSKTVPSSVAFKIWTSQVQLPLLLCKTFPRNGTQLSHSQTEHFSGSSFYVTGFLMVATTENTTQIALTTMSASQLSDIIQQVPQVLGHMSRRSRKALLSTSRQFRSQMHQTATSVKIHSVEDISLLVSRQWSQLKIVNMTAPLNFEARSLTDLAMADWPLLEAIDLTNNCLQLASWKVLAEAHWPRLRRLSMRCNDADAAKLWCLVTGSWPWLEELDLSNNFLDEQCMQTLSKRNWPQLKKLNLQGCRAPHADGLAHLTLGNWPCLESLNLSQNLYLPTQGLMALAEAHRPLFKNLDLGSTAADLSIFGRDLA